MAIVVDGLTQKQMSDLETRKINASNVEYDMKLKIPELRLEKNR